MSVCTGFILARTPVYVSPTLLGAFIDDLGFSGSQAGVILSSELIGIAASSLAMSSAFVRKYPLRRVAVAGALVAAGAGLVSAMTLDYWIYCVVRGLAGIGGGLAITACAIVVARQEAADRIYARVSIVLALTSTIILYAAGFIMQFHGYRGLFLAMAALSFLAAALFRFLSDQDATKAALAKQSAGKTRKKGLLVTAAVLLFSVADIGTWAFIDRIGQRMGLPPEAIGVILGTGALLSVSGALVASWLGLRFGRPLPLAIGIGAALVSILWLVSAQNKASFAVGYFWFSASWFFCTPYILGLAAALDDSGRWVSTATSAVYWGMAIAPGLSGVIYDRLGLNSVGYLGAVLMLMALLIFWAVARSIVRSQTTDALSVSAE